MKDVCVVVDDREHHERIASALSFFNDKEYDCKIERLPIGDYLFDRKLIFEWKTPADFIQSVMNRRVFKQLQRMKQYPFHYLIIVGDPFKWLAYNETWNEHKCKKFEVNHLLGALATILQHDKIIMVDCEQNAFQIMDYLVKNVLNNDNHEPIDKPICKLVDPVCTFLCCIENINSKKAILIRDSLQLQTLHDLLHVSKDDLVGIKGIGGKTADKILEVLK